MRALYVANNALSGPLPPEFGSMTGLRELGLTNNRGLEGVLPSGLAELDPFEVLLVGGTGLCAPSDPRFQAWLDGVHKRRVGLCEAGQPPMAYLAQAVQSREFPVPLVAGRAALLRVFPIAQRATGAGIPAVRARFFVGGREVHVENIPGKSDPIPDAVDEGSLSKSANAEIPAEVIQPGLEMVIEVDPDGALDPALGVATRIPESGRMAVDVRAMPLFDLTLIPFIWSETRDSLIVGLVEAMAADPENHEMFSDTRALLPVGDLVVTAHEPVLSTSNNAFTLLYQTAAIQAMEGGTGHWKGMMNWPITGAGGVAWVPGRSSFSQPSHSTVAHELGHNMNLHHAPCGGPRRADPSFPYSDGTVGVWGYDFRDGGGLVRPSIPDLMSYCGPPDGVSDYHFSNALRYRLFDEGPLAAAVAARTRSLLLWGGIDADGVPFMEPAFVVDAPAALPDSAGVYEIAGRSAAGAQLFSLSFTMPETADGDGSSGFVFALPVRPAWSASLASITLTGPGGSVTLDGDSDRPMAILRDPRSGQVRAILRDVPDPAWARADAAVALGAGPGLEVLFSRGIPGQAAWRP
ncbi:M66 family metalloprotease [Candidatus Palauibacter sp.]|uniref:M66 family metalloprotease n=1 Tax=Candidatus Palauibacter sp. TaxID=3101350 RepID=UPI003B01DAB3